MRTLGEDLLLLALDDEGGKVGWQDSPGLGYALVGSLLAELALRERVSLEAKHLVVNDSTPTGDDLLDEALQRLAESKKPHDAKHWVTALHGKVKHLQRRLEDRLVTAGIVRREEHRVLWVFPAQRYPAVDSAPEEALRERLRAVVRGEVEPDERTLVLLSRVRTSTHMLDSLFPKAERKDARKRAKVLVESELIGKAVSGAIRAAAAAAAAASSAAATVVIIAGSS